MRYSAKTWWSVALLVLSLGVLMAQEIIPVEQVKPGMTGYGLSAFRHNRIERFQVQVIDVLSGVLPGENIILVRCGPAYDGFDLDRSGVIAGMSGSPVYIEGKLAGALSLGWSFSKEPIAGVTPIQSMLDIARRPLEKKMSALTPPTPQAVGGLVLLQTPLVVSGVTPQTFHAMRQEIFPSPWLLVQGGGNRGQAVGDGQEKLAPGSAIGCQLVSGDIDITALGTVTWVKDNEVLAFGHSLFNAGELAMPITTARVVTVMESQMLSFKLGFPLQQVGSLYQDRNAGIYGRLGKVCDTLPLEVTVKNRTHGSAQTFRMGLVRHPFLTIRLAALVVSNCLSLQEPNLGGATAYLRARIEFKDNRRPLTWENVYAGDKLSPLNLLAPLRYLTDAPFDIAEMSLVHIHTELVGQPRQAQIAYLRLPSGEVQAGETIRLVVGLLPQQEKEQTVEMSLQLPDTLAAGDYLVVACSGSEFLPPFPVPEDGGQYLNALQVVSNCRNNQLVVSMQLPKFRLFCNNKEMAELPESVVGNLLPVNSTRSVQLLPESCWAATSTDYMLTGVAMINIKVKTNK